MSLPRTIDKISVPIAINIVLTLFLRAFSTKNRKTGEKAELPVGDWQKAVLAWRDEVMKEWKL